MTANDVLFINQTTKQLWDNSNQSIMDSLFENNNIRYVIKEQVAFPFEDKYEEIEVLLDNISDDLVNTNKVYSDFVKIIFKDCKHKQNYKGQYYKINIDDEHEEYYICYDRINRLQQTATTKVVRCNNVLTWQDSNGIHTLPCYLGTDISSTNNQITKKVTIPNERLIILVQANDFTKHIQLNQRFMFQHNACFRVEAINDFMQEQGTDGEVTFVKIYIDHSTILPTDNKELNVCDYIEEETTNEYFTKEIVVDYDGFNYIKQGKSKVFRCYTIDENGIKIDSNIYCVGNGINENYYNISKDNNTFTVSCNKMASDYLTLTFSCEDCENKIIDMELRGVV